jgi:hypothetical protein
MPQPRPLRSKDLDFLLLTGCSCLLALLHHPVAGQLTARAISDPASEPLSRSIPSQSQSASVGQYSALPSQRQRFNIRDDESAKS